MKKIFVYLFICLFVYLFITGLNAIAASPAPTADPVKQKLQEEVESLKDKIASKVAELNLVEKRGIIGKVNEVSGTQITLTDIKDQTRIVDVDELTKFSKETSSFGFSDIKKDMTLGVLGLYNKESKHLLARDIQTISLPKIIVGSVATIDSDNFIVYVKSIQNEQITVDYETTTATFSYDSENEKLVRSGFSKIIEGEKIFIKGKENDKEKNRIAADRIIIIPAVSPSAGSGKKLTPLLKR